MSHGIDNEHSRRTRTVFDLRTIIPPTYGKPRRQIPRRRRRRVEEAQETRKEGMARTEEAGTKSGDDLTSPAVDGNDGAADLS